MRCGWSAAARPGHRPAGTVGPVEIEPRPEPPSRLPTEAEREAAGERLIDAAGDGRLTSALAAARAAGTARSAGNLAVTRRSAGLPDDGQV